MAPVSTETTLDSTEAQLGSQTVIDDRDRSCDGSACDVTPYDTSAEYMSESKPDESAEIERLRSRLHRVESELAELRRQPSTNWITAPSENPLGSLYELAIWVHRRSLPVVDRMNEIFDQAGGTKIPEQIEAIEYFRDLTRWLQDRAGTGIVVEESEVGRFRVSQKKNSRDRYLNVHFTGSAGKSVTRGLGAATWTVPSGVVWAPPSHPEPLELDCIS